MMTLRWNMSLFDSSTTVNLKPVVDYFDENNINTKRAPTRSLLTAGREGYELICYPGTS